MVDTCNGLDGPDILPGGSAIAERPWPVGRKQYRWHAVGSRLPYRVRFQDDAPPPQSVQLRLDCLRTGEAHTTYIDLDAESERSFRVQLPIDHPGVHRCRIKYLHDGDWYWDSAGFAWFIAEDVSLRDMRLYTIIPNASGHINQWQEDIDRAANLGFNAIHILPLSEMGYSGSPYATRDPYAVEPALLNPMDTRDPWEQVDAFVDSLVQRGMKLIVDLVLNHVSVDSLITRRRPEWIVPDGEEPDGLQRAGWEDGEKWHKWPDVVRLHYNTPCRRDRRKLRDYMTDYAMLWADRAAKTGGGIRLDNLHSSNVPFVRHVLGQIRTAHPQLLVLGEFFDDWSIMERRVVDYGIDLLTATPWELKTAEHLRGYTRYLHERQGHFRFFYPANSHDTGAASKIFANPAEFMPRLVGAALMGPGPWGITQGTEFSGTDHIPFIGARPRDAYRIDPDIADLIRKLNALIESEGVLQQPGNLRFIDDDHESVLVAVRTDAGERERLIVAINLSNDAHTIDVDLTKHGVPFDVPFENIESSEVLDVHRGGFTIALRPFGYQIFRIL